jgi:hypothetical protein
MNLLSFFSDHPPDCGCCGGDALGQLLFEIEFYLAERSAGRVNSVRPVYKADDADPPYVEDEAEITRILAEDADDAASAAERPILDALDNDHIDEDRVLDAAKQAESIWENTSFSASTEGALTVAVGAAIDRGIRIAEATRIGDADWFRILSGMVSSSKYYSNTYFTTQVMPDLVDAVRQAILMGERNTAMDAIRGLLDRRLRSVPYWNVVANAAANRSYHYGLVKAGYANGRTGVMFRALMDAKTSELCAGLNGTTWSIVSAIDLLDRIATATVAEIKDIAPWKKWDDVREFTPEQLYAAGVMVPPLHGRCRSQLVLVG